MITVDTNIYISAFKFGRRPMELLEMAARGEIEIAVSQAIIDETLSVLRDKFAFSRKRLDETRAVIEACTIMVTPTTKLNVIPEDESDNRILECALESGSDFIITGDNDLLRRSMFQKAQIVTLREYFDGRSAEQR